MGLCLLGIAMTRTWVIGQGASRTWVLGTVFVLASLTRYEAWPSTVAALALALAALVRSGMSARDAVGKVEVLAIYPQLPCWRSWC
jgi:hypothetical protein